MQPLGTKVYLFEKVPAYTFFFWEWHC